MSGSCQIWSTNNSEWVGANWWWPLCSGSGSLPPVPPIPVITSSFTQYMGVDATTLVQPWLIEPWNPYVANDANDKKRKRFIKLVCKVDGKTYEEEKEAGDMRISIDDVKMVVEKIVNINLDVKKLEE